MLQVPLSRTLKRSPTLAAAVLAISAFITFPDASLAAVFGSDERRPLTVAEASLEAQIGTLVSQENGAYCTAFCIAPDMIATASHCLYGTAATPPPQLKDLVFKTAAADASMSPTPLAGRATAAQSQNVISGTTRLAVVPPIGAASDWAVARLDAPACKAGGITLSERPAADIRAAADKGEIYQIAVHADLPTSNLYYGGPCAVRTSFPSAGDRIISRDFADPDAILFHTCDTAGGSSGSPLLINTPAGPEVVGINVGTYVLSGGVTTSQNGRLTTASEAIANTAIEISAIAGAVQELRARELMTDAADVRRLQQLMSGAGLYTGPASGRATPELVDGISRFEALTGRPQSGLVRRALLSEIGAWNGGVPDTLAPFTPLKSGGAGK
jgi:protease YdgD